ncbi:MAG: peptidyl-prolyl cis-trans isomerase [Planctomycetes bacterium]|nr:peptidyl-prolyl cis-trans isomerase [Planctomycetota bacterium]
MRTWCAALATGIAAALAAAAPARAEGDPPAEKPAALVHGRPLPRSVVYEALARRFLRGPGGDRVLEQFLTETVARREQEKRGIVITPEEVEAAVEDARRRTAEQMARHGEKVTAEDALAKFLKSAGYTLDEFRGHTRHYLALQRMAREDLAAPGEVPNAQIDVWLKDLLRKWKASTDPAALPPGAAALLGEEPLTLEQAGRWLARTVRRSDLYGVVLDQSFAIAVEARAAAEGVALPEEAVAAELYRLRKEFQRQPAVEGSGVTFENWLLERQGMTLEELRKDPSFRAALLARKVLGATVREEDLKAEFEAHPERYGETARIRRILVRGDDRPSRFGAAARPMEEARTLADRAAADLRSGKAFETVARKWSEDVPPDGPRGQPLEVGPSMKSTLLPQSILDAVFAAKEGETLGPLKAVDGWHLLLVERRTPAPSFEEARERVREDLVGARVREWRIALRTDPGLVVDGEFRPLQEPAGGR